MKKEIIVISLGGSVVVPYEVDSNFLKNLRKLIKSSKKYKFILVIGGGMTARRYQNAVKPFSNVSNEDLDWIGIHSTWLNANVVNKIFNEISYKGIISNPNRKVKFDKVLVAGGWKPGWSTDYDAVLLAKTYNAKTVINMTNTEYLYDKDPNKNKNAKKIEEIDWKEFKKIVGDKWIPGMNVPFDPIATKKASNLGLKLVLLGKNLNNFKKFLEGKKFKGSVVE